MAAIDLFTSTTPNGRKVSIMLEELGLPYNVHKLDLAKGEQHKPEYLAKNPNGKIPCVFDPETGITVFESGAILIYLADKSGQLLPPAGQERYAALAWLMFQMSAVGPMFGQLGYFRRAAEPAPTAIERFTKETERILGVLDGQLAHGEHLAGAYSIADIATYPWVSAAVGFLGLDLAAHQHLRRWLDLVGQRQAVIRGMEVPK